MAHDDLLCRFFYCSSLSEAREEMAMASMQPLKAGEEELKSLEQDLLALRRGSVVLRSGQALATATFNFWVCSGLAPTDDFGKGLGQCQAIA